MKMKKYASVLANYVVRNPYCKLFVLPMLCVAIGLLGVVFNGVHTYVDMGIRSWVYSVGVSRTYAADYLQHAPVVVVYVLGFLGIKGRHNLRDKTIILFLAYLISTVVVHTLKHTLGIMRPDGSTYNAFPSGHTATAFMSAEFFLLEYGERLRRWARCGYATAIATGLLRVYTNRHWLTDVIAGAGFGMLSVRLSYKLFVWAGVRLRRRTKLSITGHWMNPVGWLKG